MQARTENRNSTLGGPKQKLAERRQIISFFKAEIQSHTIRTHVDQSALVDLEPIEVFFFFWKETYNIPFLVELSAKSAECTKAQVNNKMVLRDE